MKIDKFAVITPNIDKNSKLRIPHLSIAAVCSIFSNLSPFAQFVGRIMRVVDQNQPSSPNNQGVVVFIARRWSDFQQFSEADQDFFDQLLPIEELSFDDSSELDLPLNGGNSDRPDLLAYDRRVLFRGDNEASNPVTIFEFKKPQRGDFVNPSSKEDPDSK